MTTASTRKRRRIGFGVFLGGGIAVALVLAFAISPYANPNLDGLEKVADEEEFAGTATDHALADTPTADYGVEGVGNEGLSTGLSGIIGVIVTFAIGFGVYLLARALGGRGADRTGGSGGDDEAGSSPGPRAPGDHAATGA